MYGVQNSARPTGVGIAFGHHRDSAARPPFRSERTVRFCAGPVHSEDCAATDPFRDSPIPFAHSAVSRIREKNRSAGTALGMRVPHGFVTAPAARNPRVPHRRRTGVPGPDLAEVVDPTALRTSPNPSPSGRPRTARRLHPSRPPGRRARTGRSRGRRHPPPPAPSRPPPSPPPLRQRSSSSSLPDAPCGAGGGRRSGGQHRRGGRGHRQPHGREPAQLVGVALPSRPPAPPRGTPPAHPDAKEHP